MEHQRCLSMRKLQEDRTTLTMWGGQRQGGPHAWGTRVMHGPITQAQPSSMKPGP